MFVTYGDHLAVFQRAIEQSDATAAMAAARKMQTLGLFDALCLCRVLAVAGDPLFERAAKRWLTLLASEGRQTLADVQDAVVALIAIQAKPANGDAFQTLEGLVRIP